MGTVIAKDDTWLLWAIIILWANRKFSIRTTLSMQVLFQVQFIALVGAMALSNFKNIPTASPVYDTVWDLYRPPSIPLLLFNSNIIKIWKESRRLLVIFLIASVGTMIGTVVGFIVLQQWIPYLAKIGAMMTGSYIGGRVNFAALSAKLNTPEEMISATVVADNSVMALYFLLLIAIPALPIIKRHYHTDYATTDNEQEQQNYWQPKKIQLLDIALSITCAILLVAGSFKLSEVLQAWLPNNNLIWNIVVSFLVILIYC